jgi:hypothetical protein
MADDIAGRFADALNDDRLAQRLLGQSASSVDRNEPDQPAAVSVALADGDRVDISFDAYPSERQV